MRLKDVKKIREPILHGVRWPRDIKKITLKIEKTKRLGFKFSMSSREAVETTARKLLEESSVKI
ncbi:MAG: hypothetical protein RQ885_08605 [Desulfurococcales archaeon]|nr:hypothetical protein [Desulfurococcales archaeon]